MPRRDHPKEGSGSGEFVPKNVARKDQGGQGEKTTPSLVKVEEKPGQGSGRRGVRGRPPFSICPNDGRGTDVSQWVWEMSGEEGRKE